MSVFFLFLSLSSDVLLSSFSIGGLPLRFYSLIILSFIQFKSIFFKIPNNPLLLLLILSTIYNFFYGIFTDFNSQYIYSLLRGNLASILIFLITYKLIYNLKRIKYFLFFYIMLVFLSCIICLLQAINFDFAWDLRTLISTSGSEIVINSIFSRDRPVGLAFNTTELGYQIATILPIAFYFSWIIKDYLTRLLVSYLPTLTLFLAAFSANTKSAILALALIHIRLNYIRFRSINIFAFVSSIGLFIYIFFQVIDSNKQTLISSFSKIPMLIIGLKYISVNPFGNGLNLSNYGEFVKNDPLLEDIPLKLIKVVTTNYPHNQIINTMIIHGWIGLLLVILFYFYITKYTLEIFKNSKIKEIKILALSLYGSQIGYFINSMFHNAGPFVLDPISWYLPAIISSLYFINKRDLNNKNIDFNEI